MENKLSIVDQIAPSLIQSYPDMPDVVLGWQRSAIEFCCCHVYGHVAYMHSMALREQFHAATEDQILAAAILSNGAMDRKLIETMPTWMLIDMLSGKIECHRLDPYEASLYVSQAEAIQVLEVNPSLAGRYLSRHLLRLKDLKRLKSKGKRIRSKISKATKEAILDQAVGTGACRSGKEAFKLWPGTAVGFVRSHLNYGCFAISNLPAFAHLFTLSAKTNDLDFLIERTPNVVMARLGHLLSAEQAKRCWKDYLATPSEENNWWARGRVYQMITDLPQAVRDALFEAYPDAKDLNIDL